MARFENAKNARSTAGASLAVNQIATPVAVVEAGRRRHPVARPLESIASGSVRDVAIAQHVERKREALGAHGPARAARAAKTPADPVRGSPDGARVFGREARASALSV
jgi:hypothetical protein